MDSNSSSDISPTSTRLQIQTKPHSTPFESATSSSDDDRVSRTLFQNVKQSPRMLLAKSPSTVSSHQGVGFDSFDDLCSLLANTDFSTKPENIANMETKEDMVERESPSDAVSANGNPQVETMRNSPKMLVHRLSEECEIVTRESGDTPAMDSFESELKRRSDTVHEVKEKTKDAEFNHIAAAEEEVESFGGRWKPHKSILKRTVPSATSSSSAHQVVILSPTDMSNTTFVSDEQSVIRTPEDKIEFQHNPKHFFVRLLNKHLLLHPITLHAAQQTAVTTARDLCKKYKYRDTIRFACFNHLLNHTNIQPYALALHYVQCMRGTPDFRLIENCFVRGAELPKAIEICSQCRSYN